MSVHFPALPYDPHAWAQGDLEHTYDSHVRTKSNTWSREDGPYHVGALWSDPATDGGTTFWAADTVLGPVSVYYAHDTGTTSELRVATGRWAQLTFPEPRRVLDYTLYYRMGPPDPNDPRDHVPPVGWTLLGSDDEVHWTWIESRRVPRTHWCDERRSALTCWIGPGAAYRYYRWVFTHWGTDVDGDRGLDRVPKHTDPRRRLDRIGLRMQTGT